MERFASVALLDARGWILMQERDEHPDIDPEAWGFPGGHLEPGEEFTEAAHRELAEETGVVVDGLEELAAVQVTHRRVSGRVSTDEVRLYCARVDLTDADVECHEGRQMVFVDPARLPGLRLTAGAAAVLPALLDARARLVGRPAPHPPTTPEDRTHGDPGVDRDAP